MDIMDTELPPPLLSLWRIKAGTKTVRTTKVSSRTLVMILETAASEVVGGDISGRNAMFIIS